MHSNCPNDDLPVNSAGPDDKAAAEAPKVDVEILSLDDGPPTTDREEWIKFVSVRNDERERELIGRFYDLNRDNGISFEAANDADSPKLMATNLRNVVSAMKSMLVLIRALDKHRHGCVQKITVEYADTASAPPVLTVADAELAVSDQRLDEIFLSCVENLDFFENQCRGRARILGRTPEHELLRMDPGRRRGPDRRSWEAKFLGLASKLAGHVVKFTEAIESRHMRGRQHILVTYVGDVPLGKKRNKAPTRADKNSALSEVSQPGKLMPIDESQLGVEQSGNPEPELACIS